MSSPQPDLRRFDGLVSAYCDNTLTPEYLAELESLLLENASLRQRYRRLLAVHGNLAWRFGGSSQRLVPMVEASDADAQSEPAVTESVTWRPTGVRRSLTRRAGLGAGLLVALAASIAGGVWLSTEPTKPRLDEPVSIALARLVELEGDAEIQTATGKIEPASIGQQLWSGQTIHVSGEDGYAVVEYADQSRLELNPETSIRMDVWLPSDKSRSGKRVLVKQGVLRAELTAPPADEPMVLATAHAQVRGAGASFTFGVSPEASRIELEQGSVELIREPDGSAIHVSQGFSAVASAVEPLVLRPLSKAKPVSQLKVKSGRGRAIAFEPFSGLLATARKNHITVWDCRSGRKRLVFNEPRGKRGRLAFSQDGSLLAMGSDAPGITIWRLGERKPRFQLDTDGVDVRSVAFSPDGTRLAAVEQDRGRGRRVRLWNVTSGESLHYCEPAQRSIGALAFSPDGKWLAGGTNKGGIHLWDVETGRETASLATRSGRVTSLAFSPDGGVLAIAGPGNADVELWDIATRARTKAFRGHGQAFHFVAFSPNGKHLAGGTFNGNIVVWNAADGGDVLTMRGDGHAILSLAFSADGNELSTVSGSGLVQFWQLPEDGA